MMKGEGLHATVGESAETRDQPGDLHIFSLTLSQLSYRGFDIVAGGQQVPLLRQHCEARNPSGQSDLGGSCRGRGTAAL